MLVDSHCHLNKLKLEDATIADVLSAARARDIEKFLCVGIDLETTQEVFDICEAHEDVVCSVGVHPLYLTEENAHTFSSDKLTALARQNHVVAIGETGLDFHYAKEGYDDQINLFAQHLNVGKTLKLPSIIHTREARKQTLDVIKQEGCLESAGVLHCFTEDWDMAKAAIDLNYRISISGIVTFRNADALRDVVRKVPLESLLVETDAPYLAPVPHRGKQNEPAFVRDVAEFIAELKGVSLEELARVTTANFYSLFPKAA